MKTPPRYVINPAAIKHSLWAPHVHQYILGHPNASYANSLYLGTAWNAFSLPYRIVTEMAIPLFNFQFARVLTCCVSLPLTVLVIFWHGIRGTAQGASVSFDEAITSVVLTPAQAASAYEQGHCDVVTDMEAVVEVVLKPGALSLE